MKEDASTAIRCKWSKFHTSITCPLRNLSSMQKATQTERPWEPFPVREKKFSNCLERTLPTLSEPLSARNSRTGSERKWMHGIAEFKMNERSASWWIRRLRRSLGPALPQAVSTGPVYSLLTIDILWFFSVSKGNSSSLMKAAANRRRSKQQIAEDKQRE